MCAYTRADAAAGCLGGGLGNRGVAADPTAEGNRTVPAGVGAGLVIPAATESVMGSLPSEHTSVGSATNGAILQTGGALGSP